MCTEQCLSPKHTLKQYRARFSSTKWTPIPALRPVEGDVLSIFFINSMNIFYSKVSDDPIFPASNDSTVEDNGAVWYRRPNQLDSILGCIDSNKFRIPSISRTWQLLNARDENGDSVNLQWFQEADPQSRGGFAMLINALMFSHVEKSIRGRGGSGLLASELLNEGYSYPVATNQWRLEAEELFKTSLARMQVNVRSIAMGVGAKYGGQMNEKGRDVVCDRTFLFKSQGWQNIHVAGVAWIIVCSAMVILLAIPIDDERLVAERLWSSTCRHGLSLWRKLRLYYHIIETWAWRIWLSLSRWIMSCMAKNDTPVDIEMEDRGV